MSDYIDTREGFREVDPESVGRHDLLLIDPETGRIARAWARDVSSLPTEPGYYVADSPSYGDVVVVELLRSPAGQWVDAGDREYLTEQHVQKIAPLTMLEPRAVTAKALIERARAEATGDLVSVSGLAREFGVES